MQIDSHQHFWRVDRGDYGWLTPAVGSIFRDFEPPDLRPILRRRGIDRTILVQAAQTEAETEYLLGLAAETDFVAGVVGWTELAAPDATARIERLAANSLMVGLRPMVQDIADDDWLVRRDLDRAFKALQDQALVFDALVFPRHLSRLLVVLDRHPDLAVVVDHGAKPRIRDRQLDPWRADMAAVAARGNTVCKLSGLATEAAANWTVEDLRPYVDHLLRCFGPGRLLWGSDWPVVERACGYDTWRDAAEELLHSLSQPERDAIFGGNAGRLYLSRRGRR